MRDSGRTLYKHNSLKKFRDGISLRSLNSVLIAAALSRVFVFVVAWSSNQFFGINPDCRLCGDIGVPFLNLFSRWDSAYYVDIAIRGYSSLITQRWEFFPFYPLVLGILGRLLGVTLGIPLTLAVNLAGFAVSNLAFLGSVYYLYRISEQVLEKTQLACNSAFFLVVYPAGVFLSAVYSESLFLLLTFSSIYYWHSNKSGKCASLSFLATLTRPTGIFLAVPYLYQTMRDSTKRRVLSAYRPPIASLVGYLVFAAYSQMMTGTPFANIAAEREFWHVSTNPNTILLQAEKDIIAHPITVIFLALSVLTLVGSVLASRSTEGRALDLYAIILFISYLTTPIISFPRYSMTLIPSYWSLARWSERRWVKLLLSIFFLALLAVATSLFVNWYSFY